MNKPSHFQNKTKYIAMRKIAMTLATCCIGLYGYSQVDTLNVPEIEIEVQEAPEEVTEEEERDSEVILKGKATTDLKKVKIERDLEYERDGSYTDTTRIQFGKKMITVVTRDGKDDVKVTVDKNTGRRGDKSSLSWWEGIDLGINTFTTADFDFNIDGEFDFLNPRLIQSRYIGANVQIWKGRIIGDYFGFVTGATIQSYNWNFGGSNSFVMGDSIFAQPSGSRSITKNKLRAEYIGIPLLLEVNTSLNPRRSFHITAGVIGKMRIGNMYGQRWNEDGNFNKAKLKGELGLNRWAADAVLRIGYGNVTLFAQAALMPLFDNNNTQDIRTFAAGFAFTFNDM